MSSTCRLRSSAGTCAYFSSAGATVSRNSGTTATSCARASCHSARTSSERSACSPRMSSRRFELAMARAISSTNPRPRLGMVSRSNQTDRPRPSWREAVEDRARTPRHRHARTREKDIPPLSFRVHDSLASCRGEGVFGTSRRSRSRAGQQSYARSQAEQAAKIDQARMDQPDSTCLARRAPPRHRDQNVAGSIGGNRAIRMNGGEVHFENEGRECVHWLAPKPATVPAGIQTDCRLPRPPAATRSVSATSVRTAASGRSSTSPNGDVFPGWCV